MNDKDYLKRLGKRISKLRKKRFPTQKEFAERLGTQKNAVGRIERGEVNSSINMLRRIAKELRISLSALVDTR